MKLKYYLLLVFSLCLSEWTMAHVGPQGKDGKKVKSTTNKQTNRPANYREDCVAAEAQIDQSINNVRARLLTGGDVWWNGSDQGRYIVPKVTPGSGVPEKSSIFAGAVWLGGFDPGGNLKLAAQTYSQGGGEDFWPGPLSPTEGSTDSDICKDWDRFFTVKGSEIDEHLRNFEEAKSAGTEYDEDLIPEGVKGWPARGNEFFFELRGFELPNTTQGLAAFFDTDGDGFYEPQDGDYPRIELRGCDTPQYPDEMIFWIYNDNGAPHTQSNADAIQMEIQVQAFAYATNDEINDMTFQRYKLINRAIESIDSTYFAIWVDADLGCPDDDFVGCDIDRSLAFVYNRDMLDGITGCECNVGGQVNTYCDEVPLLGVDYFRGPLGPKKFAAGGGLRNPNVGEAPDTIVELPMSSFTYFLRNDTAPDGGTGMGDPVQGSDYYNLLSGRWKDGTPLTDGGTGYDPLNTDVIPFAFPNRPDDALAWTMANENLEGFDTRTIQASGPFRLDPGAVNELIVGVVWVPDVQHPNPNIDPLLFADDIAQALFDNCFDITDGPDAPDVDWIELDKEIIAIFTNDDNTSNNAKEQYAEVDLQAPTSLPEAERTYQFEGYKLFQLSGPNVSIAELDDPNKARVIYQVDKRNGVTEIFNWSSVPNPGSAGASQPDQIWVPESQVQGQDLGISHTFSIKEDQFADGDRTLINQRKYYFTAIAYAHNNYQEFTQFPNVIGQRKPYLEGRRNIGDGTDPFYTVIPREIVVKKLNADFGNGAEITRLDGIGAGGVFLDMKESTVTAILDGSFTGEIDYKAGQGPINIKIYNPLAVKNGEFQLTLVDENMDNTKLDEEVNWVLTDLADGTEIASAVTINLLNEQIIGEYGFSIAIEQRPEVGEMGTGLNGVIGSEISYSDPSKPEWLNAVPQARQYPFNATQVGSGEALELYTTGSLAGQPVDQDESLINISGGLFFPYILADFEDRSQETSNNPGLIPVNSYISPAWVNEGRNFNIVRNSKFTNNVSGVRDLNNVDIVFTSDKSKWSRCVIVETANVYYTSQLEGLALETENGADNFDVRDAPSVGLESGADGLPAPDGDGVGMGWFPGYAIDVESGKRLNIFFGENSVYRADNPSIQGLNPNYLGEEPRGGDMTFNPSNILTVATDIPSLFDLYAGGQHFVYVTDSEYDECAAIRERLDPNFGASPFRKRRALEQITWSGMLLAAEGTNMLSYDEGLIPNDVTVKLRVDNPYQVEDGTGEFNGYPTYLIKLDSVAADGIDTEDDMNEALRAIKAVPNPYLGYSAYETSQFTNTVKITNLPADATVTIYSLDGRFIRQYIRNETGRSVTGNNRAIRQQQITPALEWDLKNSKGIPVSSGTYLVHIDAPGLGEKTIKWFGVQRQFDPSGL